MILQALKNVIKSKWYLMIVLLISTVFVIVLQLLPAYILQNIIDNYFKQDKLNELLKMSVLYFMCLLFSGVFDLLKQWMLIIFGENVTCDIRKNMAKKIKTVEYSYFSNNDSGEIVSRFMNDVDTINSLFTDGVISMVIDLFKIISIVVMLFVYSVNLGLFSLLLIPIIFIITNVIKKNMLKYQLKNRKSIGEVNNQISETIKNHDAIYLYSKEDYLINEYNKKLQYNYIQKEKVNFFDSFYSPLVKLITAVVIAIVMLLTSSHISVFGMTIGMLAGAIELITSLFSPIDSLGMELQTIQKAVSGIKRVDDFAKEKDELHKTVFSYKDVLRADNVIKIEHVTFGYNENQNIFEDISLEINNGITTIVGRTGIGKSTLFKLIMGMLVPNSGKITINDIDVLSIQDDQKANIFGYVSQKFNIIKGSVYNNITLNRNDISYEKVYEVLKKVKLYDYIQRLPEKLDTDFSKAMLTKGQVQLFSLARVLILDPKILLLDEMTANVDSLTENDMYEIIKENCQDKIVLTIAHRLSAIMLSDKVVKICNKNFNNSK